MFRKEELSKKFTTNLKTKKRKIIVLFLVTVLMVSTFPTLSFGANKINVYVNGQKVNFNQEPITVNGRTLVPMRPIFEAMGIKVEWDQASQQAIAYISNELTATINIGYSNAFLKYSVSEDEGSYTKHINETLNVSNDVNAQVVNGNTMVPLRLVGELAGYDVLWNDKTKTVNINKNAKRRFAIVTVASPEEGFEVGFSTYYGYGIGDGSYTNERVQFVPNGVGRFRSFANYELTGTSDINGKINGYGYLKSIDDSTYTYGYFKNNIRNGQGKEYYNDDSLKFEGTFKNGLYSEGTYYSVDGDIFTGQFDAAGNYKYGTLTEGFSSNVYTGSFYNGEFHGKGTYYFAGGTKILSGSWNMGEYVGE